MKKWFGLVVILVLISLGFVSASLCNETDEGKDYFIRGVTNGVKIDENDSLIYNETEDVYEYEEKDDYCKSDDDTLREYYCRDDGGVLYIDYKCSDFDDNYACSNGACVNALAACTDSDGEDKYTKGVIKRKITEERYLENWDFCSSSSVVSEGICLNEDYKIKRMNCELGCEDGRCISSNYTGTDNQTINNTIGINNTSLDEEIANQTVSDNSSNQTNQTVSKDEDENGIVSRFFSWLKGLFFSDEEDVQNESEESP